MKTISLNFTNTPMDATEDDLQRKINITTEVSKGVLELRKTVTFGLVDPKDEKFLTGTLKDQEIMHDKVTYGFDGIIVEVSIDSSGYITLDTEKATSVKEDKIIEIITLVCTSAECVTSHLKVHLHPAIGYIKPRAANIGATYGEKTTVGISELYTIGTPDENNNPTGSEKTDSLGKNKEDDKKSDL
jgi:hypothetical protein